MLSSKRNFKWSPGKSRILVRTGSSAKFLEQKILPLCRRRVENQEAEFYWHKKFEQEKDQKKRARWRKSLKRKAEENAKELEELKRRRVEREKIRSDAKEAKEKEKRVQEAATAKSWAQQEEEFFLKQVPVRSRIRLEQGRAKPIDVLARYVTAVNELDTKNVELETPLSFLDNILEEEDLEDLREDIKVYKKVHTMPGHQDSWTKLGKIVDFLCCQKMTKCRQLNPQVEAEIEGMIKGKTTNQLEHLKTKLQKKLTVCADVSFYERILSHIEDALTRQSVVDDHARYVHLVLKLTRELREDCCSYHLAKEEAKDPGALEPVPVKEAFLVPCGDDASSTTEQHTVMFLAEKDVPSGTPILDADEDLARLHQARENRKTNFSVQQPRQDVASSGNQIVEKGSRKLLNTTDPRGTELPSVNELEALGLETANDGETDLNSEVVLSCKLKQSTDIRYQPQKPRYFNKVQTGFFWNRYNRTHYDSESPPPKMVLGYKFSIFYPDLMDKSVIPHYTITPCHEDSSLAVIRFSAGPPYKDVAFQIVNDREWDRSERRGFMNWFQRGVLQLWFRFKKMSYRR